MNNGKDLIHKEYVKKGAVKMAVLSFYVPKCYNAAWYISGGRFMDNWPLRTEVQLQSWRCAVLHILWMQWQLDLWSWQQWRPLLQTWEWVQEVFAMRNTKNEGTTTSVYFIQTIRATKNLYLLYMKDKSLATFDIFSLSEDYFTFFGFNDWTCGHLKKCLMFEPWIRLVLMSTSWINSNLFYFS